MERELSRQELDDLLGAYALDAVDADERAQVERYLERDPRARALVAQYREVTALLAQPSAEAPIELWERIEDELDARLPAPPPDVVPLDERRRTRRHRLTAALAAAAAALVIGFLGVKVVQQDDRIDDLASAVDATDGGVLSAARNAADDPRAERVALTSADGDLEARIIRLPDGEGFLVDDNLETLARGRTYQLWALVGDRASPRAISAGVLGRDPGVSAFKVGGKVVGFAITEELAPGVVATERDPILSGTVS